MQLFIRQEHWTMKQTFAAIAALIISTVAASAQTTERLRVDATDAPRNILHATLAIPVAPGPLTLVYPKWLPGNHRPTGPIQNFTGLHFKAAGKELEWQRDLEDMWAFHLQVPAGVTELEATYDTITYNGKSSLASSKVLDLVWNQVILYPQGAASNDVRVTASVRLPEGWKFGTALTAAQQSGSSVEFQTVSLTTLVDSPLIAGAIYRQVQLTPPGEPITHVIDMVGESEEAIAITDKDVVSLRQLVVETGRLFGARHYTKYHFLLILGDQTAHHGLEHHESSDNGAAEDMWDNPGSHDLEADLLPHEFVHSWNGKYKRPAGLATRDYQAPMHGDLLWVYEGLTDYLGNILAARTGLRSPDQFRENLAYTAAMLDHRAGRAWRPLQDTATSVQSLFAAPTEWTNWRRTADYYPEGYLIWLEVDSLIRQKTNGQKSMNDFCRAFYGGQSGPPQVVPYKFEDVVGALNQVVANDWARLLRERLDAKSPHAPMGGITNGGWRLVYTDQKNTTMEAREKSSNNIDLSFSLGFIATKEGELRDVIPGSPAYAAGLGPGMTIIAVNGRKWSKDVIRAALRLGMHNQLPISLLAENGEYYKTYDVNYHEGEHYPHLVRVEGQANILDEIIKAQGSN
ncbi:MAG TPA: M61 family peptidase [Candidatus Angelobacter sp.]|nr:M61 family peptidase [Candidatus Angelobacter sp.]